MANRLRVLIIATLLSLIASYYVISAQAHTAESFTILIKEDGFSHSDQQIIQNDSVIWYNIDNGSNLTHRLVYDHDGDGRIDGYVPAQPGMPQQMPPGYGQPGMAPQGQYP